MRIRKKLIFLHTLFSLILATLLIITVRPALQRVVREAEGALAERQLHALISTPTRGGSTGAEAFGDLLVIHRGDAADVGLTQTEADRLRISPGPVRGEPELTWRGGFDGEAFVVVGARLGEARRAAWGVYGLLIVALVSVYALIAVALEVFVLPRHVYGPIRTLLAADRAVQRRDGAGEIIPESMIPGDEMGEIMRSRNNAILSIRRHEAALSAALEDLEDVAGDLKRKNHLLENTRRNLEGADRLMSLGMMSAGIAHELNTPLAVAKGLVERLLEDPSHRLEPAQAALLGRVIGRLERLSDGLLDFARAREPRYAQARLAEIIGEAITLVRLDRGAESVRIENRVDHDLYLWCDADRMVQVFVNLIRNAVDAVSGGGDPGDGRIEIDATETQRDGSDWITVKVADNGPGIDPGVLATLFEPFVSTRLDSKGTGLGLAVAEGIVREHAGTIIVRNRRDGPGAEFEIMMPQKPSPATGSGEETR